jgi:ADP-ribose pyrophosphatase
MSDDRSGERADGPADDQAAARRAARIAAYDRLRAATPWQFANPPGSAYEILFDAESQRRVSDQTAAALRAAGLPPENGDVGVLYQDTYITVVRDAVRYRSGAIGSYIRIAADGARCGPGAVLFAVHDGKVVLIRHFRHGVRDFRWELPRGFGDPGESAEQTARREGGEEIGADVLEIAELGAVEPDSGMDAGAPRLFWARVSEPRPVPDDEGIDQVRLVTAADLVAMLRAGEIVDGYTLAALAHVQARGLPPFDAR